MAIDPTQPFAIVELERIKWFLGNLDLTKNEDAGNAIQEAHARVSDAIKHLRED